MHPDFPVRSCEQVVPSAPALDHLAGAIDDEDHVLIDPAFTLLRAYADRRRSSPVSGGNGFGSRVEPRCTMKMRFGVSG